VIVKLLNCIVFMWRLGLFLSFIVNSPSAIIGNVAAFVVTETITIYYYKPISTIHSIYTISNVNFLSPSIISSSHA